MVDDVWMVTSNPFGDSSEVLLRTVDTEMIEGGKYCGFSCLILLKWCLISLFACTTSLQRILKIIMEMSEIRTTSFTIVFPPFIPPLETTKTWKLISVPLEAIARFAENIVNIQFDNRKREFLWQFFVHRYLQSSIDCFLLKMKTAMHAPN